MSDDTENAANTGSAGPNQPIPARIVFEKYSEMLRDLTFMYEQYPERRREATILACQATAKFLVLMGEPADRMIIFTSLQEALKDVDEGIMPPLLRRDQQATTKDRSREREFHQMWAAVLLNVLMKLGEPEKSSATWVARYANRWSNFDSIPITATTVSNWRTAWLGREPKSRQQFDFITRDLAHESKRAEIETYIKRGPPGFRTMVRNTP